MPRGKQGNVCPSTHGAIQIVYSAGGACLRVGVSVRQGWGKQNGELRPNVPRPLAEARMGVSPCRPDKGQQKDQLGSGLCALQQSTPSPRTFPTIVTFWVAS